MILHNQLLLNGSAYTPMTKEEDVKKWLSNLVEEIGMKTILGPYAFYVNKEGNRGITGFVGIETSHIAVHVWDEPSPALFQFDLYTCSSLPLGKVFYNLEDHWGLYDCNYMVLEREQGFNIKQVYNGD